MFITLIATIFCFFTYSSVFAGDIILNAENNVEYHQKEQKIVANGNAVATKDNMSIKADTLIGFYAPKNKKKISRMEAHGNIHMTSPETEAFGDDLIYDNDTNIATLSGNPAKIKKPDTSIIAYGDINYYRNEQKAIASGDVTAIDSHGNKVSSDVMSAYFSKDKTGKIILNKIDLSQNVKITTPDAIINADKGTYYAIDKRIELFDNVTINQKGNILKGSKAETNLNTGVSKMLSDGKKGRVSGIFKEKKKKD